MPGPRRVRAVRAAAAAARPAAGAAAAAVDAAAVAAAEPSAPKDRLGLGWRPELAAGILGHLDPIDLVENVATLIEPPASPLGEPEWTGGIVAASGAPMLLDLHNLYANAVNFGEDAPAYLRRFPLDRVAAVHLAGGRWIDGPNGARRLL